MVKRKTDRKKDRQTETVKQIMDRDTWIDRQIQQTVSTNTVAD